MDVMMKILAIFVIATVAVAVLRKKQFMRWGLGKIHGDK